MKTKKHESGSRGIKTLAIFFKVNDFSGLDDYVKIIMLIPIYLTVLFSAGTAFAGDKDVINVTKYPSVQAALDAVPQTGGVVYFPMGTYQVAKPLIVKLAEGQHLILQGEGRGSEIINNNQQGGDLLQIIGIDMMDVWRNLKITIRDLTFVGSPKSGNGLVVRHANDILVDSCFFFNHGGKAVYLMQDGCNSVVSNSWMRGCKWGIYAENVHHITISGNQMRRLDKGQKQDAFIYLDKNCREVRVTANHLAYGGYQAIVLDETAQHIIVGNTIEGFDIGIKAVACRDLLLNSNYIRQGGTAISLTGACDGLNITGNMIHDSRGIVIEKASGHGGHVINSNVIRRGASASHRGGGITLGDASRCVVTGNIVEDSNAVAGLTAGPGGGKHLISANGIYRATGNGIALQRSNDNAVTNNLCSNCQQHSIVIADSSENYVANNRCLGTEKKVSQTGNSEHNILQDGLNASPKTELR